MQKCYFLKIVFLTLILSACGTSKPTSTSTSTSTRIMEYYDPDANAQSSLLNLPIKLYKSELEKSINQQVGELIYVDDNFDDGLLIKATKQAPITLEISEDKVSYKVPINLWVKKDVMITNVEAEGSLNLSFETKYNIKPDWILETTTELKNYEWTKTPVVKLGFGNLNVTGIANQFINQAKAELASSIDQQVKEMIDLKSEISRAWKELQKPILVSEEYKTWLVMNPDTVRLTPLRAISPNVVETTVIITARPQMSLGKTPHASTNAPLPKFQYADAAPVKKFSLYLGSEIPFAEAERIAKMNMQGETYTYGKRKVKVEDIQLYGKGNRLAIKTRLSGSYNGEILLLGKPDYNDRKNEIVLREVEFDFSSQRTVMKTASWLFKGTLKNTIEENLNFHLTENLLATQKAIEEELENFDLGPGLKIIGNLEELNVSHVYVGSESLNVKVGLQGNLALEVKDFMR